VKPGDLIDCKFHGIGAIHVEVRVAAGAQA
jgi:hypothetical protein